jgi:hypothetical protein
MEYVNFNPNDISPFFMLVFVAAALMIALIAAIIQTWIFFIKPV